MNRLIELYKSTFSAEPSACVQLTGSASNRKYYRLSGEAGPCIGVVGVDPLENKAFLTIARHFHGKGINVPRIIAVSEDESAYLQEDLGDVILFDLLTAARKLGDGMNEVEDLLCRTMAMLPKIQCEGASGLDFSVCYP